MKKVRLKFKLFFFFKFLGQGVLYPFLVLYLTGRGISGSDLGLILTLLPLGKVVLSPVVGYICDLYRLHKQLLILSVVLNSLGGLILYVLRSFKEEVRRELKLYRESSQKELKLCREDKKEELDDIKKDVRTLQENILDLYK